MNSPNFSLCLIIAVGIHPLPSLVIGCSIIEQIDNIRRLCLYAENCGDDHHLAENERQLCTDSLTTHLSDFLFSYLPGRVRVFLTGLGELPEGHWADRVRSSGLCQRRGWREYSSEG